MFVIIGIVVVMGCVVGGFVLEGGILSVLMQPIELLIIGGAALGSFLIACPKSIAIDTLKTALKVFTAKEASKESFVQVLSVLYELMSKVRREGVVSIEAHVNKPDASNIFGNYSSVMANHELLAFICDNFKVLVAGNIEPHHFDNLMDIDLEAQKHHGAIPPAAITKVADSLPGLGIVAAVLGVVLTMGKINEPPEVLGHSIGAALVGTFLGILLCYGFVGPAATNLEYLANDRHTYLQVAKAGLVGFAIGLPPMMAVEAARRAIPGHARPSFEEMEEMMKSAKK